MRVVVAAAGMATAVGAAMAVAMAMVERKPSGQLVSLEYGGLLCWFGAPLAGVCTHSRPCGLMHYASRRGPRVHVTSRARLGSIWVPRSASLTS